MTTNGLFPESQAERNQFHEWFKQQWQAQVGQYFETPDDLNCFDWYRIAGWDEQVLMQALDGLKRRTRHSFEAGREYEHAMSFTIAWLQRAEYHLTCEQSKALAANDAAAYDVLNTSIKCIAVFTYLLQRDERAQRRRRREELARLRELRNQDTRLLKKLVELEEFELPIAA
jgi:hypothetical protein